MPTDDSIDTKLLGCAAEASALAYGGATLLRDVIARSGQLAWRSSREHIACSPRTKRRSTTDELMLTLLPGSEVTPAADLNFFVGIVVRGASLCAHASHCVEYLRFDRVGRSAVPGPVGHSVLGRIGLTVTGVLFTLAAIA